MQNNKPYWRCPVCGAAAGNEEEKNNHLKNRIIDQGHRRFHLENFEEQILIM